MKKSIVRIGALLTLNLILIGGLLFFPFDAFAGPEDKCQMQWDCYEPEEDPNCVDCLTTCVYIDCSWMWCDLEKPRCQTGTDCFCDVNPN